MGSPGYTGVVISASTTLPGLPSSVPTARRWVDSVLDAWGRLDQVWTAVQIVSELATNCAIHARTTFTVTVSDTAQGVRLEVSDSSLVPVQTRHYGPTATTGRGMAIVESLAPQWGVDVHHDGKTVWALLPTGTPGGDETTEDDLLSRFPDLGDSTRPVPGGPTALAA